MSTASKDESPPFAQVDRRPEVEFTGTAILRVGDTGLKELKDTCQNLGIFLRFEPGASRTDDQGSSVKIILNSDQPFPQLNSHILRSDQKNQFAIMERNGLVLDLTPASSKRFASL